MEVTWTKAQALSDEEAKEAIRVFDLAKKLGMVRYITAPAGLGHRWVKKELTTTNGLK